MDVLSDWWIFAWHWRNYQYVMILSTQYALLELLKIQSHHFTLDIFCLTYISTKNLTPDLKNRGLPCSTLNKGKILMKGSFGLAFLRLHTIHPLSIFLTDILSLITQNLCLIADSTYSAPKWQDSWHCRISSYTTWCLPGSINWCFAEFWIYAFDNLSPILIIPFSFRNGVNLRSLLFFDNGWFHIIARSSVPNSSCWIHLKSVAFASSISRAVKKHFFLSAFLAF